MSGPLIRIALRYISGLLIAKGFFTGEDATLFEDPELISAIEMAASLAIAAGTEYWYKLARKFNWSI